MSETPGEYVSAPCRHCLERGKTWEGADPKCAFITGTWSPENWNCALDGKIRALTEDVEVYCDDQYYATLNVSGVAGIDALALWVSWYKHRGRTDEMLLLSDDAPPRRPTVAEVEAITSALELEFADDEDAAPDSGRES